VAVFDRFPVHATLPASDLSRARAWYERMLGRRARPEVANGIAWSGDRQSAWFKDSEGNTLSLDQPPAGWSDQGRSGRSG
jgi:catechol 2,3-dioxygenase-like lactoylglutathione lyase family enzyme